MNGGDGAYNKRTFEKYYKLSAIYWLWAILLRMTDRLQITLFKTI